MRKIERQIRKFIHEIDPTIRVVFHEDEMECDPIRKIVYINKDEFLYVYDDEKIHKEVLREKGMIIDIIIPTFILLHEIGHIKSIENYKTKKGLMRQYDKQISKYHIELLSLEDLRKYKQLRLEKLADEYAYNYYLHHYEYVKQFNKNILSLLK